MNEELLKVRDVNGYDGELNNCKRLKEESILLYLHDLNTNMGILYHKKNSGIYDEKEFAHGFIENIYIILSMFNEMNVFPGYFFRKTFEMNAKYNERRQDMESQPDSIHTKTGIRGDYKFYRDTHLAVWLIKEIEKGLNNGYFHVQAYPQTNISDAFLEILALFQKYDFTYKVTNKEESKKVFDDISFNHTILSNSLLNSDSLEEDVMFMSRLLYEYISFFVAIGVNPKPFLDYYIAKEAPKKNKEHQEKVVNLLESKTHHTK